MRNNNGSSAGEILTTAVVGHAKTPKLLLVIILLLTTAAISPPTSYITQQKINLFNPCFTRPVFDDRSATHILFAVRKAFALC
jgi:hypothetical protein